jgi:hypothetical protein
MVLDNRIMVWIMVVVKAQAKKKPPPKRWLKQHLNR